jgi:hypothetical protein
MESPKDTVSVLVLKRLLVELKEKRPDICIRYRCMGELWRQNFTRVVFITDRGVFLNDEVLNKLITIPDLSIIMQFELDNRFQNFQPYFHYNVNLWI